MQATVSGSNRWRSANMVTVAFDCRGWRRAMSVAGLDVEAADSGVASEGLVVQYVAAMSDGVDGDG